MYISESRDFQLLTRLYDCINMGVKKDIDSIKYSTSTDLINSELIRLLCTKIGFFPRNDHSVESLRIVLKNFPFLIKEKGSKQGLSDAVLIFLRSQQIETEYRIEIDVEKSVVRIYLRTEILNTSLLEDLLYYLVPTGYCYEILFYESVGELKERVLLKNQSISWKLSSKYGSRIRTEDKPYGESLSSTSTSDQEEAAAKRILNSIDTQVFKLASDESTVDPTSYTLPPP